MHILVLADLVSQYTANLSVTRELNEAALQREDNTGTNAFHLRNMSQLLSRDLGPESHRAAMEAVAK
jgi:hypothetical protein